jgi:two-component system response regulator PilR (NtrC family)
MLRKEGYSVATADSAVHAKQMIESGENFDLVVSDVSMPGMSGLDLLREIRKLKPETAVVIMTAYGTKQTAIEALNEGASFYVEKPFDLDEMRVVVDKTLRQTELFAENEGLREQNRDLRKELRGNFEGLIGRSPKMKSIFELIERVAGTNSTIMISGESGTGKELIARAVHYNSGRRERPFVSINCGALPDELLESELFGHMKGSFTGATDTKKGLFEVATGGTIFLDEIGETSSAMQIKLLRVLQERCIRRVGGTEEIDVDVRVITATNQDLEQMVRDKQFREDLFYRINVIAICMPALREKRDDIRELAEHFLDKYRERVGKSISGGFSQGALECLEQYLWPGNVRQLENVVERAVALETSEEIRPESLPAVVRQKCGQSAVDPVVIPQAGVDLELHLEDRRRRYMQEALERAGSVQTHAAELLGMTFRSFRYFAKKYRLTGRDEGQAADEPESREVASVAGDGN